MAERTMGRHPLGVSCGEARQSGGVQGAASWTESGRMGFGGFCRRVDKRWVSLWVLAGVQTRSGVDDASDDARWLDDK